MACRGFNSQPTPPAPGDDHARSEAALPDGLAHADPKGRGANLNPGNRFESIRLHVLGDYLDQSRADLLAEGEDPDKPPQVRTTTLDDASRSILNPVDSPDISFSWTINPYRGCEHGCIYCYARPGHEYLGLSSGLDFETRIIAKPNAPELFQAALLKPKWKGETIVMSGVTDCYQPMERELNITRRCLEVALRFRQTVGIITKNALILRDLGLLQAMHQQYRGVHVSISLTTLDPTLAAKMEPRASSPRARLDTIRALAHAGIPVRVMTAPIIPAINDHELPALLEAGAHAGAKSAGYVLLRLPYQIKALYTAWLERHFPDRAAKALSLLRQCRDGELYKADFFTRGRGTGPIAQQINQTFKVFARKHNLDARLEPMNTAAFAIPPELAAAPPRTPPRAQPANDTPGQLSLFHGPNN